MSIGCCVHFATAAGIFLRPFFFDSYTQVLTACVDSAFAVHDYFVPPHKLVFLKSPPFPAGTHMWVPTQPPVAVASALRPPILHTPEELAFITEGMRESVVREFLAELQADYDKQLVQYNLAVENEEHINKFFSKYASFRPITDFGRFLLSFRTPPPVRPLIVWGGGGGPAV